MTIKTEVKNSLTSALLIAVVLALVVFIFPEDNPKCELHPRNYVINFLLWVSLPAIAIRIFLLLAVKSPNKFLWTFVISVFVMGIVETVFFYYGMVNVFRGDCWGGWEPNFIASLIVISVTFKITFVISLLGLIFACCLPCICMFLIQNRQRLAQSQEIKNQVISSLVKTKFDHKAFKNDDCAICLSKFDDDCDVTPLPCDIRHYFHTECISSWFEKNNICPLCKKFISKQDLDKLGLEIEDLVEQERHKE